MASDLFHPDGKPALGAYTGQIREISLADYRSFFLPDFMKRYRAKRWRFAGFYARDVIAGIAVVDAGYIGTAFAYAFDLAARTIHEFSADSPLARACRISDHVFEGESVFEEGTNRIAMRYTEPDGLCSVDVGVATPKGRLEIKAHLDQRPVTPHQVITPTPHGSFAFTHKAAALPAAGRIVMPGKTVQLSPEFAFGAIDHTAGYHDYYWEWRWASLGGLSQEGAPVGLNLVAPIHHPTINENALWANGERFPVGRADFTYNPRSILDPWEIATADRMVELTFTPLGERAQTINAGIIASRFHQPIGLFSGRFTLPSGERLTLKDVPGVVKEHESRW